MAPEKKNTEEVIPTVDNANKDVLEFAKKEEAEADRIFYEAQGLQPDGKTPLEEEPEDKPKEDKPKEDTEKPEDKPNEDPEKGMPVKEDKPKETEVKADKDDDDLTKDLKVENADKRISAAQNKMHASNKTAKDAVEEQSRLQKENADLRKIIDEKATKTPEITEDKKPEEKQPSEGDVEKDLEALRTEYPEIAEPMIKMMAKQNSENKLLRDRLDKQDARETERDADAKATKDNAHYEAIAEVHSDFNEISQEPLLDEWIDGLPAIEKAGAKSIRKGGSTEDVISLLTTFKKANGYKVPNEEADKTPTKKVDSKLEKAKKHAVPQFNKAKEINTQDKQIKFTQEQIKGWSEKEWADNEKEVDEAMKLGLVR